VFIFFVWLSAAVCKIKVYIHISGRKKRSHAGREGSACMSRTATHTECSTVQTGGLFCVSLTGQLACSPCVCQHCWALDVTGDVRGVFHFQLLHYREFPRYTPLTRRCGKRQNDWLDCWIVSSVAKPCWLCEDGWLAVVRIMAIRIPSRVSNSIIGALNIKTNWNLKSPGITLLLYFNAGASTISGYGVRWSSESWEIPATNHWRSVTQGCTDSEW